MKEIIRERCRELSEKLKELRLQTMTNYNIKVMKETEDLLDLNFLILKGLRNGK